MLILFLILIVLALVILKMCIRDRFFIPPEKRSR